METVLDNLIGNKIERIFLSSDYLKFVDDHGHGYAYRVEGDCCSLSVFYDFYGVTNLFNNGPVIAVYEVPLKQDVPQQPDHLNDAMQVYGYALVTQSQRWGEVTSVFSFRNYSNGYYGGFIVKIDVSSCPEGLPEITADVVEVKDLK